MKLVESQNLSHAMSLQQRGGPNYFPKLHSVTWVHLLLVLLTFKILFYTEVGVAVLFTSAAVVPTEPVLRVVARTAMYTECSRGDVIAAVGVAAGVRSQVLYIHQT